MPCDRHRLATLVFAVLPLVGSRAAEGQSWSPDGRWLAYVQEAPEVGGSTSWLLRSREDLVDQPTPRSGRRTLWAIRVDGSGRPVESVELGGWDGALTPPCWNRDGTALAYGRVRASDERGPARFELVVQDAPERERVLQSWSIGEAVALDRATVAWSPDGAHLAAPRVDPAGLVVVRADDGRVVRELPGGAQPSWSPSGDRLAYAMNGEAPGEYLLDLREDSTRRVVELPEGDRLPPPVWSQDGRSLLVVVFRPEVQVPNLEERRQARQSGAVVARPARPQLALERIGVETGVRAALMDVPGEPFGGLDELSRLSLATDRAGDSVYVAEAVEGEPSMLAWLVPRVAEVRKRTNPFYERTPLGPLAAWPSPSGRRLAVRMGELGRLTPPALFDLDDDSLTLLHPDEAARELWVAAILRALDDVLEGSAAATPEREPGGPTKRPTPLPSPGELDPEDLPALQLQRLATLGQSLCDPALPGASGSPRIQEAGLIFDYLLGDYEGALARLDAAPPKAETPDARFRLLGLRAQIYLGLGQYDRAGGVVEYLRGASPSVQVLEDGPDGPIAGGEAATAGWPEVLANRLSDLRSGKGPKTRAEAELTPVDGADEFPEF